MRTYLVTGGAGFIGSNYIHYMFKKYDNEIRIINVDKLTYAGNLENLKDIEDRENYTFVKADICDSEAIMKIFDENDIDRVVHFAAESHVDRSIRNPEVFVKTNVLGTLVMLNAAKSAWELPDGTFKADKKFLHVSTDEVYGSLEDDGSYFYETTPYAPHSPYSASKASSDMLVKAYIDTYKFPANITNCSNNYGPYQFPEKLIPLIINNALQGKKLPVYGDGKNVRDWLYVDDHAKGIDMVQEKGRLGETYNIGGHNEKQNIQIIEIIIDTLQEMLPADDPRRKLVSKDLITYVADRKGHDRRYAIAPDKIKDEDYYVLTLAAIAKELKAENLTEAHIVIAAGLPLTWTSGQKADFRAYLMKNAEVEFVYKKTAYHIYIDDVRIYPQGYAAIASFATTLKGVNLIADIGNGTMNTLYMINGKPQQGKMFTEKFGTYQCTLAVREAFMQKTQREINDAIIDEVLITGTANIAPADLKIIKSVAAEYVRDIFRRLREHGYDENTMTLYVTGGGGCLVKNFYKFSADRVKFVEDICAAAKGYEYLAEAQMKAEAKG